MVGVTAGQDADALRREMQDLVDKAFFEAVELDCGGFHHILVGDGSGINKGIGWAVLHYDTGTRSSKLYAGAVVESTINVAELIGYLHVLARIRRSIASSSPHVPVLVLSDSRYCVDCGSGYNSIVANKCWWAALEELRSTFDLTFQRIERNSFPAAEFTDDISRRARKLLESLVLEQTSLPSLAGENDE